MMNDPYETVDWDSIHRLHSVNHTHTFSAAHGEDEWEVSTPHLDGQAVFDSMYDCGIRHFAIANYHPSKPTYPLREYFDDVPDDVLGCPNGEHSVQGSRGHYTPIGSAFESKGGYDGTWQEAFRGMLEGLVYDDGGGIVINHPKRTGLSIEALLERLDFDPRVLGIEAYNHRSMEDRYYRSGNALALWDELLLTGRSVFGFFNPDLHSPWDDRTRGRNVLLIPEVTESAAARAYRRGHSYGAMKGSGLAFERISASKERIVVETNGASKIEFISDRQVAETVHDRSGSYDVNGKETYVRIEAFDDSGERIFSQPICYDHGVDDEERFI